MNADPSPRTEDPHTLIEDKAASQLVFAYEAILSEMRTYADAGDRTIANWVQRLDSEREDFVRAAQDTSPRKPGLEERLRKHAETMAILPVAHALSEAADEIARLTTERDALRAYIIYTPCPKCGLPDPLRVGAACEQCAIAAHALNPEGAAR